MRTDAELDAMSEEDKQQAILSDIAESEVVRLCNRGQVEFWGAAADSLKAAGKITVEHKENYEGQYSWIQLEASDGKSNQNEK